MKTGSNVTRRPARAPQVASQSAAKSAARPFGSFPLWVYGATALAAFILLFVVYGPALDGPFLLDDSVLPYMDPQAANAPLMSWIKGVRPLLMLTFWINFQSSGVATGSYHLFNLVLHFFNGVLIFLIVRKLLGWAQLDGRQAPLLAVFAAGLFLLHPVQTESVTYVASRSETLSVFFFLSAFTVFLYRKNTSASFATAAMVLVLFGAACLSKEHAAVLPALLLLTDYYWNPGFSLAGIRRNWRVYLPIAIAGAAGLAFVWRVLSASTTAGFGMKDLTWYQYFFTESRAFWHYIRLFLLPLGQNIDHDFPVSYNILDHGAIVGLDGILALISMAWVWRRRFPLESYGVFTLLLLLAPTSSFIPIRDAFVEKRMYLPFVGLLLITVGLLRHWITRRSISQGSMVATLGLILLMEAGLTFQRNQLWASAIAIWRDSVTKAPSKFRPRFQLAYAYYNAGQCKAAVEEFDQTSRLGKPDYGLFVDWALAYDCAGNPSAAIDKLNQAAALEKTGHVYSQIGMEYAKQAKYPQALDALETAAKLDPNFGLTYVYRGNIYSLQGNKARAAEEYRRALAIDPENQVARDGLIRVSQ